MARANSTFPIIPGGVWRKMSLPPFANIPPSNFDSEATGPISAESNRRNYNVSGQGDRGNQKRVSAKNKKTLRHFARTSSPVFPGMQWKMEDFSRPGSRV